MRNDTATRLVVKDRMGQRGRALKVDVLVEAVFPQLDLPGAEGLAHGGAEQLATVDWGQLALLVWHGPLPQGELAQSISSYVRRGGQVLFVPPRDPAGGQLFGVRWQSWAQPVAEGVAVEHWRGDLDLLAHTQSGAALPVGQLEVRHYCEFSGDLTPLATLSDGAFLLARATTSRGGVYFLATTPAPVDSSLAADGVVLYVAVQRAVASGAAALGKAHQLVAGQTDEFQTNSWKRVAGAEEALSTAYAFYKGVYAAGKRLCAVNLHPAEARAPVVGDLRIAELFQGLDFIRVDGEAGSQRLLIREIWRLFLVTMMIALVVEAALCLPRLGTPAGVTV